MIPRDINNIVGYMSVKDLSEYLSRNPIDTNLSSIQIRWELEQELGAFVNMGSLVLAALLCGYSCSPGGHNRVFKFSKAH